MFFRITPETYKTVPTHDSEGSVRHLNLYQDIEILRELSHPHLRSIRSATQRANAIRSGFEPVCFIFVSYIKVISQLELLPTNLLLEIILASKDRVSHPPFWLYVKSFFRTK